MSRERKDMTHPLKKLLPEPAWRLVRSTGTAVLTPLSFSLRTGHLRSSFSNMAVTAGGDALPWYTYPIIDFLTQRDMSQKTVLEFGAGQSSLWWAKRAKSVMSLEGDAEWYAHIKNNMPANVDLHLIAETEREKGLAAIRALLEGKGPFDIIVIDGLWRRQLIETAFALCAEDGAVLFDNSDGYGVQEETANRERSRVDFYGFAPGVSKEACTSIFFKGGCFLFAPTHPLPKISR